MALGDQVQRGKEYIIEFGDAEFQTTTMRSLGQKYLYNQQEIMDQRNAVGTVLMSNPRYEYTFTCDVDSSSSLAGLYEGALASFTPYDGTEITGRVISLDLAYTSNVLSLTMTIVREDSMQATYDAVPALDLIVNMSLTEVTSPSSGDAAVKISGTIIDSNTTSYKIYRNTTNSRPANPIAQIYDVESASSIYVDDNNVVSDTTYYYWVESIGGPAPNPINTANITIS
jgi:hypothetical protein